MAKDAQSGSMWLPGVVLLAVAATSYLVHQTAFHSSRPIETKSRSQAMVSPEDVEARLWQDPLSAVDEHLKSEESAAHGKPTKHHDGTELRKSIEEQVTRLSDLQKVLDENAASDGKPAAIDENAASDGKPAAINTNAASRTPLKLTVLAVMVPRAPYAEPAERRRRIRYAVLSGMSRSGLVPEDQEHIFFFTHKWDKDTHYIPYEFLKRTGSPKGRMSQNETGPALVLWLPTEASQDCPATWLTSVFAAIVPKNKNIGGVQLSVLGPPESGTLAELVREAIAPGRCLDKAAGQGPASAKQIGKAMEPIRRAMQIYSPWASAADKELTFSLQDAIESVKLPGEPLKPCLISQKKPPAPTQDCDIEEIVKPYVRMVRLIGDDVLLSNALLQELQLRGVDPACAYRHVGAATDCFGAGLNRHRIAIVSEWDAPYQRALRWTLMRSIAERCGRRYDTDPECDPSDLGKVSKWLLRFSYLRGVDGQIADVPETRVKQNDDKPKSHDPSQPWGEVETVERADGNAQLDYVRRLAERIEHKDRALQSAGDSGIGAIGVLGTDPYDKLTILQALHERFPNKVFFTTNLDARLIHPQESKWARNLIVVSDFGLELSSDVQSDIPPLRDGYQTAAFFATLFAMHDHNFDKSYLAARDVRCKAAAAFGVPCSNFKSVPVSRSWFTPLVFEVGRTHAIRLGPVTPAAAEKEQQCPTKWDFTCTEVQPRISNSAPLIPDQLRGLAALTSGLAVALVGMLLIHGAKPRQQVSSTHAHRVLRTQVAVAVALALAAAGLAYGWNELIAFITQDGMGEPAALFEGVSIWPAQFIRLLILCLAIAFLFHSHARLKSNRSDIVRDFRLPALEEGIGTRMLETPEHREEDEDAWARLRARFAAGWRCLKETASIKPPFSPRDITSLWTHYMRDGRACARLCRVFFFGMLFTALSASTFLIWPEVVRFRGELSYETNRFIFMLCVLTFNMLLFYVVDALLVCNRCVKRLISGLDWPPESYAEFAKKLGDKTPLKEWMTVQLIARRTDAVGSLVYLPFLLLFLIILSRNSVFERWSLPVSVVVLLTVSTIFIVFAAVRLRETTEAARTNAIESLTSELILAKGTEDKKRIDQLTLIIQEVRELRTGAFAPYTEQKFIRALLLPLGGFASSALIEYLSLVRP